MKRLFFAAILALGLSNTVHAYIAESPLCAESARLDYEQRNTILRSYFRGEPYGFGYSLAAIAWKESMGGAVLVNANDPSFGVYHILLDTAAKREGIKGGFAKNQLAHRLVTDEDFAASHAIQELSFWQKKYKDDWLKIWASYNAGHKHQYGEEYAKDIQHKVKVIRTCLLRR